jgi:hypothetical protein
VQSLVCDPPNPEWTCLLDAYNAYSAAQGIDLCIGRRTHRLFRAAGVVDIYVDAIVRVYPAGDHRRLILRDFINNIRGKLIDGGFIGTQRPGKGDDRTRTPLIQSRGAG